MVNFYPSDNPDITQVPNPQTGAPMPRLVVRPQPAPGPGNQPSAAQGAGAPAPTPMPPARPISAPGAAGAPASSAADPDFIPYDPLKPKAAEPKSSADDPKFIPYDPLNPPPKEAGADRQMGRGEAAATGAADAMTFGTAPLITGGIAAANVQGQKSAPYLPQYGDPGFEAMQPEGQDQVALGRAVVGVGTILSRWLKNRGLPSTSPVAGQPPVDQDPEVVDAFERGRQEGVQNRQIANEQHPGAYAAGQIAGMLVTSPLFTLGGGAAAPTRFAEGINPTLVPTATAKVQRIASATGTGALTGGAQSFGGAASEEKPPLEIAKETAEGAGTGAIFGLGGGAAAEGLESAGRTVVGALRGARGQFHASREAARRTATALGLDRASKGGRFAVSREGEAAAQRAGTPLGIVDYGGEETRALATSAANISPEAADTLKEFAEERFHQQAPRISGYLRSITGRPNAGDDNEVLRTAARLINRPRYRKAYSSMPTPLQSARLDELSQANAVKKAIALAEKRGSNKAVADGLAQGFDPKTHNIQFWDYVQRELSDRVGSLFKNGKTGEAAAVTSLKRQVNEELDRIVPAFGDARKGAAAFFGAEDAMEAGQKFVMGGADIGEARRALAKMSEPERELFARGFASDLADKIMKVSDHINVVNQSFLNSRAAREKIEMALGPDRARQLEVLLRTEGIVDQLRKSFQRSTTFKQALESGALGGGATGLYDWFEGNEFSPSKILRNSLIMGSGSIVKGKIIGKIDERVAIEVAKLLTSDKAELLQRGIKIIANRPPLLDALRQGTTAIARYATAEIGLRKAAAGAASMIPVGGEAEPAHVGNE